MSTTTRELITIQSGRYANFVGTHWWNLQEASFVYDSKKATDINHDFLFRDGLTPQRQETYTPRLLCVDIQGSLCSLPSRGHLYAPLRFNPSTSEAAWEGSVDLVRQPPQDKNQFLLDLEEEEARYLAPADEDKDICIDDSTVSNKGENNTPSSQKIYDLSKSVEVWSDFLRPHLHPDSIYLLDSLLAQGGVGTGEEEGDRWGFPSGSALFHREEVEDEITDRIRLLAESCNSLQGFQILSDVHNGMGGVSCGILQHISDEYGSKDTITFTTSPPHFAPSTPQAKILTQAAIIQSYTEMSQLCSMVVPLSLRSSIVDLAASCAFFPNLTLQENNAYLSSSILGAFLETASTAYRTRSSPLPLAFLTHILTPARRKIVGGSLALPLMEHEREEAVDLVPLSAGAALQPGLMSQVRSLRGAPPLKEPRTLRWSQSKSLNVRVNDSLKTTAPFPAIFSHNKVTTQGNTHGGSRVRVPEVRVESVRSLGVLHQGDGLGEVLEPVLLAATALDVTKAPQLLQEGLDKEAWSGVVEVFRSQVLEYCAEKEGVCSDED